MLKTTRQMLAASWDEPEACQHAIVSYYSDVGRAH